MVKVPQLIRQVPQRGITTRGFTTDIPVESFGGGRGLDRLVTQTRGFIQDQSRRQKKQRSDAEDARFSRIVRDSNNWWEENVDNPDTGALNNLLGQQAIGSADLVENGFRDFSDSIEKSLQDSNAPLAFRTRVANFLEDRRVRLRSKMNGHEDKEGNLFILSEAEASISSAKRRAQFNPEDAFLEQGNILANNLKKAERLGWGEKQTREEFIKHTTDLHTGIINGFMAKGQYQAAEDWLEGAKNVMDPEAFDTYTIEIENRRKRADTFATIDNIMDLAQDANEARDIVKDVDPDKRAAVKAGVEAAIKERQNRIAEEATRFQDRNPTTVGKKAIDVVPWSDFKWLTVSQRDALTRRAAPSDVSDPQALAQWSFMTTDEIKNMSTVDFITLTSKLSSGEQSKAQTRLTRIREAAEDEGAVDGLFTDSQIQFRTMQRRHAGNQA